MGGNKIERKKRKLPHHAAHPSRAQFSHSGPGKSHSSNSNNLILLSLGLPWLIISPGTSKLHSKCLPEPFFHLCTCESRPITDLHTGVDRLRRNSTALSIFSCPTWHHLQAPPLGS